MEVQWADRVRRHEELHQRLAVLEKLQGAPSGVADDLRQRLAEAEQRARAGEFDELTGLRNRRGMKQAVAADFRSSGRRLCRFGQPARPERVGRRELGGR